MNPIHSVVLATRNAGKIRELKALLSGSPLDVLSLEAMPHIVEPEELGATFARNACDKALYYARATGQWCLADDSGLEVDALDGEPGIRSARYAAEDCPPGSERHTIDLANNARLLAALKDVPDEQRTARFVCHVAMASPEGVVLQAFDTLEGRIGRQARGEGGFGYDPLFILPEMGCTTAELPAQTKNGLSHRGKAMRGVASLLANLLRG